MSSVLLIRHAEADFSHLLKWKTLGWGADLAPLTEKGILQGGELTKRLSEWKPDIILVSPTTRTLSTALIIAQGLSTSFRVEFDLHEWVPDMTFRWKNADEVEAQMNDMINCCGEWPDGEERVWEPLSNVRRRTLGVLQKYREGHSRIAVICHAIVILALTGMKNTVNCGSNEIQI